MNLSRKQLQDEITEKTKDLDVFAQARDLIRKRVIEVQDSPSQLTPLPNWSGTDAVLGSLDLAIHAMEGTVNELQELLKTADDVKPMFTVIKGGLDEQ